MKTDSTYRVEHEQKGVRKENLSFAQVREFAFRIRQAKNFSPIADTLYDVIDEATGDSIPMQHIPN